MKEEERKLLTRDEVLALLHDVYEHLSNTKYVELTHAALEMVQLSLKLADVYSDLQGAKNISEVGAIGFEYVEPEDVEDEDETETPNKEN